MDRGELFRTLWTNPIGIRAMLWAKLPLAAFAGLRIARLDENGAEVTLPAGWKTQNPFRSTYFAAQAMAAEMSTGATALYLIERASARVSTLVTGLSARFTRKATQLATFTFADGAAMRAAIDRAVATGEGVVFAARSIGRQKDGTIVAEFEIEWSFKQRRSGPGPGRAEAAGRSIQRKDG
ncbi:MAG: PaaI family thioesterase [Myxococcales bacterium]